MVNDRELVSWQENWHESCRNLGETGQRFEGIKNFGDLYVNCCECSEMTW